MKDVTNLKLFSLKDNIEWIFQKRQINFKDVSIITKPFKLTVTADITFVIKNLDINQQQSIIDSLHAVLSVKVDVLRYDQQKHENKITSLSNVFVQGEEENKLKSRLIPDINTVKFFKLKNPSLEPSKMLNDAEVVQALFNVSCNYFNVILNGPENEMPKANYSEEDRVIIEDSFNWNPFVVSSNGKADIMTLYMKIPNIKEKITSQQFKDEYGQTCLQKAIFCRHERVVNSLIWAIGKDEIIAYLDLKDKKGASHWDTARSVGFTKDLESAISQMKEPENSKLVNSN